MPERSSSDILQVEIAKWTLCANGGLAIIAASIALMGITFAIQAFGVSEITSLDSFQLSGVSTAYTIYATTQNSALQNAIQAPLADYLQNSTSATDNAISSVRNTMNTANTVFPLLIIAFIGGCAMTAYAMHKVSCLRSGN